MHGHGSGPRVELPLPAAGAAALLATLVLGAGAAYRAGADGSPPCEADGSTASLAADSSLYCIELVPHPDVRDASGTAALRPGPGPFTVSVTADGRLRHDLALEIRGLPPADSLGPYGTYVAWAMPPSMDPVIRLGEVGNGRSGLGTVALDRFLLLVTAEPAAEVETRSGPPVLRGLSPGMQMSDIHVMGGGGDAPAGTRRPARGDTLPSALEWRPPPMNPRVSPMALPGLGSALPGIDPYLPPGSPTGSAGSPGSARSDSSDLTGLEPALPRQVVELGPGDTIRLEAAPVRSAIAGTEVVQLAYNRQLPGPLIRVREGATVYAWFVNRSGWPGTIHWHGVRLENPFDGVPGVTQSVVRSGERFLYRIRFPDAGIYWYHPHHREDVLQDLGLAGNILVAPEDSSYYGPAHREEVLMLDDLLMGETGLVPFGLGRATHAVMGRFGNRLLVNGSPGYRLRVRRGEVVRFHLTNASNVRTFNLSFGGAPMKVVASDVGRFQREERVESVVLAPAERYVVEVRFPESGSYALTNRIHAIDHGADRFFAATDTLGAVTVGRDRAAPPLGGAFQRAREPEPLSRTLESYRRRAASAPRKELVLTMEDRGLPFSLRQVLQQESRGYVHPVEWTRTMPGMSWLPTAGDVRWILREPSTGRENGEIDWSFRVGDLVRIRLHNRRRSLHPMQHPIHIHGQRFLILAVNGVPRDNLAWKDTALIPVGATVDILLELSNPGEWMIHCHISEHLEAGMQFTFTVEGDDSLAEEVDSPVE